MQKIYCILTAALLCALAITLAASHGEVKIASADSVKFKSFDPHNHDGIHVAVIFGDMVARAPLTFLAKIPKGPLPRTRASPIVTR